MKIKTTKLISLLLCVCMCMSVVLTACNAISFGKLKKDPVGQVFSSSGITADGLMGRYPALKLISDAAANGSVSFSASDKEDGFEKSISAVAITDSEANQASYSLGLIYGGIDIDAKAYLDGNSIAVSVPSLASGTYGVKYSALEENLRDSEFISMFGLTYDDIKESADELIDSLKDISGTKEETAEYFADVSNRLKDEIRKTETEVTKEKTVIGENEIKAFAVTCNFSTENLKNIYEIFKEVVKKYADNKAAEKACAEMGTEDECSVEEILGRIDSFISDNKPTATVRFLLNRETADVMKLDGTFSYEAEEEAKSASFILTLGEIPSEARESTLEIKADGICSLNAVINRTDTYKTFGRSFSIDYDDESDDENDIKASLEFSLDKEEKTYEASFTCDEDKIILGGSYSYGEESLEITADKLEITDEEIPEFEAKLTFTKGTKPETMPEYKDLLTMTSDEIDSLSEEIGGNIGKMFGSLFGGYYTDSDGEDFGDGFDWDLDSDDFALDFDSDDSVEDIGGLIINPEEY